MSFYEYDKTHKVLTEKQELKEIEECDKRIAKIIADLKSDRERKPKTILLHNRVVVKESELTEDIIDREIAWGFEYR